MTSRELDFSRYAPDRSRAAAVWSYTDSPVPGELAMLAGLAAAHARQIGRCGCSALAVIRRRITRRIAACYTYVLHTLSAAWTVAGIGWGLGVAFPLILYLTR